MTFKVRHIMTCVFLALLLLSILIFPVIVAASQTVAINKFHDIALFESNTAETHPESAIACNCPNPGGSQGGCC